MREHFETNLKCEIEDFNGQLLKIAQWADSSQLRLSAVFLLVHLRRAARGRQALSPRNAGGCPAAHGSRPALRPPSPLITSADAECSRVLIADLGTQQFRHIGLALHFPRFSHILSASFQVSLESTHAGAWRCCPLGPGQLLPMTAAMLPTSRTYLV